MLQNKNFEYGTIRGTIYDFPYKDDILPLHWHSPENVHITIVARGAFRATGNGWTKLLKAGDVLNWSPYQQHQFVALEDNSRIVNVVTGTGNPGETFVDG
jgi:quercetin dioxygenase-like cupin family protein